MTPLVPGSAGLGLTPPSSEVTCLQVALGELRVKAWLVRRELHSVLPCVWVSLLRDARGPYWLPARLSLDSQEQ